MARIYAKNYGLIEFAGTDIHSIENKVFAVFLAEPISDLTAAIITTTVFLTSFGKILKNGPQKNKS